MSCPITKARRKWKNLSEDQPIGSEHGLHYFSRLHLQVMVSKLPLVESLCFIKALILFKS